MVPGPLAVCAPRGPTRRNSLDVALLEDRTLFSATPLILDAVHASAVEDGPATRLALHELFSLDDKGGSVEYSIAGNSLPRLFERTAISDTGDLVLRYAANQHGVADLRLRASDAQGNVEVLPLHVLVESVNDAPTTRGLANVSVTSGSDRTVIRLFDAFDDVEDADQDLTFTVAGNTNPDLFSAVRINPDQGLLILEHAAGKAGRADLTIVATDTGGLSVGLAARSGFAVYDEIEVGGGQTLDTQAIGLFEVKLCTDWCFYKYVNGRYDYTQVDVDLMRSVLNGPWLADYDGPVVFNLEHSFFENTPAGRDRFAEILAIANQIRPDLDIGIYRYLPERNWYTPVNFDVMQQHQELGITTWYTNNSDLFTADYQIWQANNALYRTQPVSGQFGGQPLADMVDAVHPSLYTFFRNENAEPVWRPATLDAQGDTITVEGQSFAHVNQARVLMAADARLPSALSVAESYYVVNASGSTFQLARTPGGPAIDFGADFSGRIYVGDAGPWPDPLDDPDVVNWRAYAEHNIAEVRKFDKPVYAWISPSLRGQGFEHLDQDFFRLQLEILKPLVDGIVIFEPPTQTAEYHVNQAWWRGLSDFMQTLDDPAATFTVKVSHGPNANQAPVAAPDTLLAREDVALTWSPTRLLTNDLDADQQPLKLAGYSQPEHGSLVRRADGRLQYRPDANYFGDDSFTYRATDGKLVSNSATVTLHVQPVNDQPMAQSDRFSAVEDQPRGIDLGDLLANDRDPDRDDLYVRLVDSPQHGTLRQTESGQFIYTPDPNYAGADRFTYRVNDGAAGSNMASVTINVQPVNDEPRAVSDVFRLRPGGALQVSAAAGLLENDRDVDRDELRTRLLSGPEYGVLELRLDGSFWYRPQAAFTGVDSFQYIALDGQGGGSVAEVILRVGSSV